MKVSWGGRFLGFAVGVLSLFSGGVSVANDLHGEQVRWTELTFAELHQVLERCAVQPYSLNSDSERVDHDIQSECEELQIFSGSDRQWAVVTLSPKEQFVIELKDSLDSDGGDLGELSLYPAEKTFVVKLGQVLAFRDPIKAILSVMNPAPTIRQKQVD